MNEKKHIGGVFPLASVEVGDTPNSIWNAWTLDSKANYLFHNARSAIAYCVSQSRAKRFWIPAYICSAVSTLELSTISNLFYPVDEQFNPCSGFLEKNLVAGDIVLFVNYFGRPNHQAFTDFVRRKADVLWIEDCSQALDTGAPPLGDFRVFSPRKLLGVPDGGLLVDFYGCIQRPNLLPLKHKGAIELASKTRALKGKENRNDLWYPAFVKAEASMRVTLDGAHPVTRAILENTNMRNIARIRRENYLFLLRELGEISLLDDALLNWVPMGFPVRVSFRNEILKALHNNGVFASCHWSPLTVSTDRFLLEHSFSSEALTLPCDHRYSLEDMKFIVDLVRCLV